MHPQSASADDDLMRIALQLAAGKDPPERLLEYRQDLAGCLTQQGRLVDAAAELQALSTSELKPKLELSILCQIADLQVDFTKTHRLNPVNEGWFCMHE